MHIPLPLTLLSLAIFPPSALTMTISHNTATLQLLNPASALPSNSTLLNGTSNGSNRPPFICNPQTPGMRILPKFADCAGVLRSLPLNPTIGIFYNSGAGNFQLPYFETYRTCTVLVELRSTYDRVRSSWLAVQVAALELNDACQDVRTATGLGSASTYIDSLEAMKVTLRGPVRQVGDGEGGGDAVGAY